MHASLAFDRSGHRRRPQGVHLCKEGENLPVEDLRLIEVGEVPRIGHRHQLRALDLAVDELDVLQGRILVPDDAERRRLDLAQAVVEDRALVEGLERQGVAVGESAP